MMIVIFTGVLTCGAVWLSADIPPVGQSIILGTLAITFAITEAYFGKLLTELNAILRSTSLSQFQAENLRQIIIPAKTRIWTLWWFSVVLKIVAVICSGLLFKLSPVSIHYIWAVTIGYASVILTIPIAIWSVRNFQKIEKKRDDLAMQEISIKERTRLTSELKSGEPHDFTKDEIAKGYSRPAVQL
jgi:hypothetical protein